MVLPPSRLDLFRSHRHIHKAFICPPRVFVCLHPLPVWMSKEKEGIWNSIRVLALLQTKTKLKSYCKCDNMEAEDVFCLCVSVCGTQLVQEHLSDCSKTYWVPLSHSAAEAERRIAFYHISNQTKSDVCYGVGASGRARQMQQGGTGLHKTLTWVQKMLLFP